MTVSEILKQDLQQIYAVSLKNATLHLRQWKSNLFQLVAPIIVLVFIYVLDLLLREALAENDQAKKISELPGYDIWPNAMTLAEARIIAPNITNTTATPNRLFYTGPYSFFDNYVPNGSFPTTPIPSWLHLSPPMHSTFTNFSSDIDLQIYVYLTELDTLYSSASGDTDADVIAAVDETIGALKLIQLDWENSQKSVEYVVQVEGEYSDFENRNGGGKGEFCQRMGEIVGSHACSFLKRVAIMDAVHDTVIVNSTGGKWGVRTKVGGMPYTTAPPQIHFWYMSFLGMMLMPILLLLHLPAVLGSMVQEKVAGLREMMALMGLRTRNHVVATYGYRFVWVVVSCWALYGLGYALKLRFFTQTDPGLIALLFMGAGLLSLSLAFLFASFISTPFVATLVGYTFITFFPFMGFILYKWVINPEDWALKPLLLIPPLPLSDALQKLMTPCNELHRCLGFTEAFQDLEFSIAIAMLYFDALILFLISLYLDQVSPRHWGVRKHPLYCFCCCWRWLESSTFCQCLRKDSTLFLNDEDNPLMDDDVRAERERIHGNPSLTQSEGIVLKNIVKTFGTGKNKKHAVRGVTFSVHPNECFGLLGPNGAGKTTTIRMLCGLHPITSGDAWVAGFDVKSEMPQIRHSLGLCPQESILWPDLTAAETILFYARLKGVPLSKEGEHVDEILRRVGLRTGKPLGCCNRFLQFVCPSEPKVLEMSAGLKRRLSIAISLTGNPTTVLLDEPVCVGESFFSLIATAVQTTGLDLSNKRAIWNIISAEKKKRSVILTTHSMEEADTLSDRIGIVCFGRLRVLGTSLHLKNRFGNGYTVVLQRKPTKEVEEDLVIRLVDEHLRKFGLVSVVSRFGNLVILEVRPYPEEEKEDQLLRISSLYRCIEECKDEYSILDFELNLSTLEDVFLNVVKRENDREARQEIFGFPSDEPFPAERASLSDVSEELAVSDASSDYCSQDLDDHESKLSGDLFVRDDSRGEEQLSQEQEVESLTLEVISIPSPSPPSPLPPSPSSRSDVDEFDLSSDAATDPELISCYSDSESEHEESILVVEEDEIELVSIVDEKEDFRSPVDVDHITSVLKREKTFLSVSTMTTSGRILPSPDPPQSHFEIPTTCQRIAWWFRDNGVQLLYLSYKNCLLAIRSWKSNLFLLAWPFFVAFFLFAVLQGFVHGTEWNSHPPFETLMSDEGMFSCFSWSGSPCVAFAYTTNGDPMGTKVMDSLVSDHFLVVNSHFRSFETEMSMLSYIFDNPNRTKIAISFSNETSSFGRNLTTYTLFFNATKDLVNDVALFKTEIDNRLHFFASADAGQTVPKKTFVVRKQDYPSMPHFLYLELENTLFSMGGPPWFSLVGLMLFVVVLQRIVMEKETGLRVGLEMVGMRTIPYFLTWYCHFFVLGFLMSLILVGFACAFQMDVFLYTNQFVMLVVLNLYNAACIMAAFAASSLFVRVRSALVFGFLLLATFFIGGLILAVRSSMYLLFDADNWIKVVRVFLEVFLPPISFDRCFMDFVDRTVKIFDEVSNEYIDNTGFLLSHLGQKPVISWFLGGDIQAPETYYSLLALLLNIAVYFVIFLVLDTILWTKPAILHSLSSCWQRSQSSVDDVELDEFIPQAAIQVSHLCKQYRGLLFCSEGVEALEDVSFSVLGNNVTTLLGRNGAGKSTCQNIVAGVVPPSKGDAVVRSLSCSLDKSIVRKMLGMCFQENVLFDELTAHEHVRLFALMRGYSWKQATEEIQRRLTDVSLFDVRRLVKTFSGGMKRRLNVALSFATLRPIMVLDEPTTGLDPASKRAVWSLVLSKRDRCAILMSTHEMEEAQALSDRIVILDKGTVMCVGDPLDLKRKFGAGVQLKFSIEEGRDDDFERLIRDEFPSAILSQKNAGNYIFNMSRDNHEELISGLQQVENVSGKKGENCIIREFGLSFDSLEDVYFAVTQNREDFDPDSEVRAAELERQRETSAENRLARVEDRMETMQKHIQQVEVQLGEVSGLLREFLTRQDPISESDEQDGPIEEVVIDGF